MPKKNILITGLPGTGKTTLTRHLAEELKDAHPVGFCTAEIRERGIRKGFELISLSGQRGLLAHVDIRSPFSVGKYGVDVRGFEEFLRSVTFLENSRCVVIIDEIGKMECLSDTFRRLIREILDSDRPVIATIALKGGGIMEEIRKRDDAELFEITVGNRDSLPSMILERVRAII